MSSFRILSIDGGGIKGTYPAAFLAALEEHLPVDSVADYFDLIAGTSVGGIIALGLGLGLNAKTMLDFFVKEGPKIFTRIRRIDRFRRILGDSKYSAEPLRTALTNAFGKKTIADSKVRLLIPSFDLNRNDIHIYKTPHHERLKMDHKISAVDVALATAAAPTYFPAHDGENFISFVDGGLWANNPCALAVVEAITLLNQNPQSVEVLSLGCSRDAKGFQFRSHELVFWARNVYSATAIGQSSSALGMAKHLTGRDKGRDAVYRVDPVVEAGIFSLDGVNAIDKLRARAYGDARQESPTLAERFFRTKAIPYQPFFRG
ncbi:MAG: CBASS cGAMP-activated phospholipase [Candidatus Acidiferrales bacterium]